MYCSLIGDILSLNNDTRRNHRVSIALVCLTLAAGMCATKPFSTGGVVTVGQWQ